MNQTKRLFTQYFLSDMSEEELMSKIGFSDDQFESRLRDNCRNAMAVQDGAMVECLVYVLLLWESVQRSERVRDFVPILNRLLVCPWHNEHKNIVLLLQRIQDNSSVPYLYDAIGLPLPYLAWDNALSFQVNCILAIGAIGTEEAVATLEALLRHPNQVIQWNAGTQLNRRRAG